MQETVIEETLSHQEALIYVMVIAAIADCKVGDTEIVMLHEIAKLFPVFDHYTEEDLERAIANCFIVLDQDDGLDIILTLVKASLPPRLYETAYAFACEVISADGKARQEELRWLAMLRDKLEIDPLHVAAIERSARVRYMRDSLA